MSLTVAEIDRQLQINYPGYEKIEIEALRDYSFKWFKPINILLRNGYNGLNRYFTENRLGRGITNFKNFLNFELLGKLKKPDSIPEAIENVQMRIDYIDSAFLNSAPRSNREMIAFRGKRGDYYNESHSLDTVNPDKRNIDTGYISTTEDIEIALRFVNNDIQDKVYKKTKQHCCLYRMHIMEGIPYVDMTKLSKYQESEILLPRDLKITTIESDDISRELSKKYGVRIIDIRVEKNAENQFDKEPVGGKRRTKKRTNKRTKRRTNKQTKKRKNRRTKKRTYKY
jgi:hypothetical protein